MSGEIFTIAPPPWMQDAKPLAVIHALAEAGFEARYVGGCVRDAVLGRADADRANTDIDIATVAPPETVTKILAAKGIGVVPTGIEHGTVTAIVDRHPFEVTTLRRDVETDGRRAKVVFTDRWEEDAARRDFTMNALSATPAGRVADFFGGREDLAAGIVRFVGEPQARIAEDVLRLLRYFRFHAHYGKGEADQTALVACRSFAHRLPSLSGERIRTEILKLLKAESAAAVWRLMLENGIVSHVLPQARDSERLAALVEREAKFRLEADPLRRLAAVHGGGVAVARAVSDRLKFSRIEADRFAAALAEEPPIAPEIAGQALRAALYRLGRERLLDRWLLAIAATGLPHASAAERLREIERWPIPALPVRGADVLALGVDPGPAVKILLGRVEDWWMAADFRPDRAACLSQLERLLTAERPAV